jgi:hypothetical protein
MRVFWHNGALQLLPESEREAKLLAELSENVKFEKPPEMQDHTSGGHAALGGDSLLEHLIGQHEVNPSRLSRNFHDKQSVVRIHKLP